MSHQTEWGLKRRKEAGDRARARWKIPGYREKIVQLRLGKNMTHGLSKHPMYLRWGLLKERCENPNNDNYRNYGARGIKVEWKSFEEFHNDMVASFDEHVKEHGLENTSLDRIDNDGNYSKKNCRWATRIIQVHNRRLTTTFSVREIAEALDVKYVPFKAALTRGKSLKDVVYAYCTSLITQDAYARGYKQGKFDKEADEALLAINVQDNGKS